MKAGDLVLQNSGYCVGGGGGVTEGVFDRLREGFYNFKSFVNPSDLPSQLVC